MNLTEIINAAIEQMIETTLQKKLTAVADRLNTLEQSTSIDLVNMIERRVTTLENVGDNTHVLEVRMDELDEKVGSLRDEREEFVIQVINDYDFSETINDSLEDYDPADAVEAWMNDNLTSHVHSIVGDMKFTVEVEP